VKKIEELKEMKKIGKGFANASHSSVLSQAVKKIQQQLRHEEMELKEMKKIGKGFARVSQIF
jgi:chromosomal replication initiation ATPase DnaA